MHAAVLGQPSSCVSAGESIGCRSGFVGQRSTENCHSQKFVSPKLQGQKWGVQPAISYTPRTSLAGVHSKLLRVNKRKQHAGCCRASASGDSVPVGKTDDADRSQRVEEGEGEYSKKKVGPLGRMLQYIVNQRAASAELLAKIQSFGVAGVLSYGLFNTLYYIGAFLFVWIYVVKVPRGLGVLAASQKFVSVMAIVWAGSQLTKLVRAGGALLCAPLMDRLIDATQRTFSLKQRSQAFAAICGVCWILFVVLFTAIILIWA